MYERRIEYTGSFNRFHQDGREGRAEKGVDIPVIVVSDEIKTNCREGRKIHCTANGLG
jgi:hypothetical protein